MLVSGRVAVRLLHVAGVWKSFDAGSRLIARTSPAAVKNVTVSVEAGQTLGIVGESGSGKSTLLRMILRLVKPTAGQILYRDRDIWKVTGAELLQLRREVQAIFQDPASSFNPRQKIGAILSAPLEVHGLGDRQEREAKVVETLKQMGLPAEFVRRYPHQLSGGQRQRVAIARAIILKPSLVLADEPTSALDVSVQAQILNLFRETKEKLGLTTIFVSHNLAIIRYLSDHIAVMRQGEIVETGRSEDVFSNPRHSYTQALLEALPDPKRRRRSKPAYSGANNA
jgi:peptide/nickel transport system ATP-binding protein